MSRNLTPNQQHILNSVNLNELLTETEITEIAQQQQANKLNDESLLSFLKITNALYRGGEPLINDSCYDSVFLAQLQQRQPEHEFLKNVEPEADITGKTISLPARMLSTDKAYTEDSINKWLIRLEKAALEINITPEILTIKATPKLDGYAAYDDGTKFYTRGDGRKGTDISRVFERGLQVAGSGQRGLGAGEIVVNQSYFEQHLAEEFENSRNFQASIIKEKALNVPALEAIQQGAAVFYPFSELPSQQVQFNQLLENFNDLISKVLTLVDYDVDGVVLEITDETLKAKMGATRHHHRWQIAFKNNAETAEVKVLSVTPQTSRSGRVNPVAELEPTKLSGAMISRATAHHYGMVKNLGIGENTLIELTRSGLVIPKIERVIIPQTPQIPTNCPSCNSELVWDSDYLYCLNTAQCSAQIEHTIEHFFKTLANIDGFGEKTIEKLVATDCQSVYAVYQLTTEQLQDKGFGEKTAQNLIEQLKRSRSLAIEDWRFLGAFGIHRMGLGNCERLLQHHHLNRIFDLSIEDISAIEGFADKTSITIIKSLATIRANYEQLFALTFNLIETPLISETPPDNISPIFGKTLVFTGAMQQGNRNDMKKQAKALGAKVGSSVSGKTDYLITGEKVGEAKINAATEKGVTVLSENEYLELLA